jgi:hypothetical protein
MEKPAASHDVFPGYSCKDSKRVFEWIADLRSMRSTTFVETRGIERDTEFAELPGQ